jgi:DNA-binding transcriptional LysR family regulator
MDRIDAMTALVATVDAGGLSAAARRLGRSPASITRAVAFLEERTGTALLRRTTRAIKPTEAGERYLAACRRILAAIEEAEQVASAERAEPRGLLTVTAPAAFGRLHLRPVVDAFIEAHREVQVRLLLLDRVVNLVDEGVDVAVRIAHMPDSSLVAVKVGDVRRITCASPAYLARRRPPERPSDLASHDLVAFSQITPNDVWTYASSRAPGGKRPVHVRTRPRLTVNAAEAAVASAAEGHGVTRVLSYQIAEELRRGRLVPLLVPFEPDPLPVHVVHPAGVATAKVRAFVDAAVPALRAVLARTATAALREPPARRRGS